MNLKRAAGLEYLGLVTRLLQAARNCSPTGGLWEAADLQWWWRRDQHPDPHHQTFWLQDGVPAAALVLTNWGDRWQCDLLSADHEPTRWLSILWPDALDQMNSLKANPVELMVRPDDLYLVEALTRAGFSVEDGDGVTAWMDAAERPPVPPILRGFELLDRSQLSNQPHHLITRNGGAVAARLSECSLYRPALDLAIYSPEGRAVTYGVFWADPVTAVGLVEPMRTEDGYQGLGLARHLLAVGLERLAGAGCSRMKVSFDPLNAPAQRLYLGAGFQPISSTRNYVRGG